MSDPVSSGDHVDMECLGGLTLLTRGEGCLIEDRLE
jgi:hypothetical protein